MLLNATIKQLNWTPGTEISTAMRFTSTDALTKMIYFDFYTAVEMEANSASELKHASSHPHAERWAKLNSI